MHSVELVISPVVHHSASIFPVNKPNVIGYKDYVVPVLPSNKGEVSSDFVPLRLSITEPAFFAQLRRCHAVLRGGELLAAST